VVGVVSDKGILFGRIKVKEKQLKGTENGKKGEY
jgi:hypothetical protein